MELFRMKELAKFCLSPVDRSCHGADGGSFTAEEKVRFLGLPCVRPVLPLVYHRLRARGESGFFPAGDTGMMKRSLMVNTVRNIRYFEEAEKLAAGFRRERVSFAFLKGVHLAAAVYENVGLRAFCDMDVLVDQSQVGLARRCALGLGFSQAEANYLTNEDILSFRHHLPPLQKGGHLLEIHASLWTPDKKFTVEPREILSRAAPFRSESCELAGLSPEDLLLHVCIHASYQHVFLADLRPYCDIAEIARRFGGGMRWDLVARRASDWKWRRGVWLCLETARDLVGASVPEDVVAQLRCEGGGRFLEDALAQVFSGPHRSGPTPHEMALMHGEKGLRKKCARLLGRVFLPRKVLAMLYPVSPRSPKLAWYYAVRAVDLARRYGGSVRSLSKGAAPELSARLLRKGRLLDFLSRG